LIKRLVYNRVFPLTTLNIDTDTRVSVAWVGEEKGGWGCPNIDSQEN